MYKSATLSAALLLAMSATALADGQLLPTLKFENQTSSDLPLKFMPQKVKWSGNSINIWGTVTNSGSDRYKFVSVSFTALDASRNFLGRQKWYADPSELSPGEIGHLDQEHIDTEGRIPSIIQVRITGNSD